ncbi:MAG TPA: hypothetical protein EYQ86_06640 [Bacteroidetes bacterium]|nr:hypothetical protein [Bacteroidota bacterium]
MVFLLLMVSCKTENTKQETVETKPIINKETVTESSADLNDIICDCSLNAYLKFSPDVVIFDTINGSPVDKFIYNVDEHEAGFNVDFDASVDGWLRVEDGITGKSGKGLKGLWVRSESVRTNIERYDQKEIVLYSEANINSSPKYTASEPQYNVKVTKCIRDWVYIEVNNNYGWISPEDQCNLAETSCVGGTRVAFESEEDENLREQQAISSYTDKLWVFLGNKKDEPCWLSIGQNKEYHIWGVGDVKPKTQSGTWNIFINSIEISPQDEAYVRRLRLVDSNKIESLIPGFGKIKNYHLVNSENFKDVLLIEEAVKILYALSSRDPLKLGMAAGLERNSHDKITFAPFAYIDTINNSPVSLDSLLRLNEKGDARHFWGIADGTGDSIILSAHMFFNKYVWETDYLNADIISIDTIMKQKFYMQSITSAFGNKARYVEFFVEGTDDMGKLDWHGLRLVFAEHIGSYKIVGVVRGVQSF